MMTGCPRQIQVTPNNSMQRTALRAAADAERSALPTMGYVTV